MSHPGFKAAERTGIVLHVADSVVINVKLEVGALSDEVTVTAERPLVNTSSGTPGQTITERQIVEMPLNNRSVLDLALTAVNVSGAAGTEDPDLGSEIPTPGMNLFINGGRAGSTSILADGARNTGVGLGRAVNRDDLHPARGERERSRPPRAREPEHERPPRQPARGRTRLL